MAVVVNNPSSDTDSGTGFFVGAILLVLFLLLLFYFGLPLVRQGGVNQVPQNTVPQGGNNAPNIQVPDKIDVNLNQPK